MHKVDWIDIFINKTYENHIVALTFHSARQLFEANFTQKEKKRTYKNVARCVVSKPVARSAVLFLSAYQIYLPLVAQTHRISSHILRQTV